MTECIAHDDDGTVMTLHTINTIAPVEYEHEAKTLALFHLQNVEGASDTDINSMLPMNLYDANGVKTHIMCARPGYENTIRNQQATMMADYLNGSNWVSDTYFHLADSPDISLLKSKMCFILGDTVELLKYLELEER